MRINNYFKTLFFCLSTLFSFSAGAESFEALQNEFKGFEVVDTGKFFVVSNSTPELITVAVKAVEHTFEQFFLTLDAMQASYKRPENKMVYILFANKHQFLEHLKGITSFSPPGLGIFMRETGRTYMAPRVRGGEFNPAHLGAVAIHETIHQLARYSGFMGPSTRAPRWVTEGMAVAFASRELDKPIGPILGKLTPLKQTHLKMKLLIKQNKLMKLESFVQDGSSGKKMKSSLTYGQGGGFMWFLMQEKPIETGNYLRNLNSLANKGKQSRHFKRAFIRAFGELNKVEKEWNAFLLNNFSIRQGS